MSTTATVSIPSSRSHRLIQQSELHFACILVTVLTGLVLMVHGYHPYAEDGGLYMAGIQRLLDPALYPYGTAFVTEHLRFSLFAPMVAAIVSRSHLSLSVVLLLLHLATVWLALFAAYLLAERCYESRRARVGAVSLLAMWITLPIAGTSLMLMDPYVTARSISTPCVLLALVGILDAFPLRKGLQADRWRGLMLCGVSLACAATMHPLMAAYGFGCVLVLGCMLSPMRWLRLWGTVSLCLTAVGVAAAIQALAPSESAIYIRVEMTRYYWFLGAWHWYEKAGLAAPLVILAVVGFRSRRDSTSASVALARMAVICGSVATIVALLFARQELATHLVARLQPLRIMQIVYIVMILAVGSALAEWVLRRRFVLWAAALILMSGIMFSSERLTFPNSAHLEMPWTAPDNQWEQAFVWIRQNTPKTALFALDPHYITSAGEDAQCFRALAERSALPDYSKDGGEVSVTPELASAWEIGEIAQSRINSESDAQRMAALKPVGVDWIVLEEEAKTGFDCPYANSTVKVCRLP
ncbi:MULTISPECIES: hypothetical protein [Acidobacteriaceae]|uniref:hypothetical protein n=1 Tax=Acidobacteriaceae TaxID=204434 RepID=UPI00131ABE83|nr:MULTISPECIES: hypothetical protein [Acidobacteriaceae]MDW5266627.1 hypothetical protein [Edaphobacter sp.]